MLPPKAHMKWSTNDRIFHPTIFYIFKKLNNFTSVSKLEDICLSAAIAAVFKFKNGARMPKK
jgi:hypothetical protein